MVLFLKSIHLTQTSFKIIGRLVLILESKLYIVGKCPMMREVSLKTLPNVNICDPSHDKNLLEIMSETGLIDQNIFKLLLILISTTKKHCNNTVKAKSFDVIDLLARFWESHFWSIKKILDKISVWNNAPSCTRHKHLYLTEFQSQNPFR